ncbi:hypothetical protein CMV_021645 [Castanea mollissima]|uniref:GST N-terminal domain-containing protein n=1 Tax=Castanea mollissima TaxID=60419 RepID=A0A8J4QFE6_9ROSI|nr:hypothetical protein CMV_021645 [Castanea mollissima]
MVHIQQWIDIASFEIDANILAFCRPKIGRAVYLPLTLHAGKTKKKILTRFSSAIVAECMHEKVPVLETQDSPVFESNAIACYGPQPTYIQQWIDFASFEIEANMSCLFWLLQRSHLNQKNLPNQSLKMNLKKEAKKELVKPKLEVGE